MVEYDHPRLYGDLFQLVQILATLPMTSASCERAHSKIKIIHSYLRAKMTPERVEDLLIISTEREIADSIELDDVVEKFKLSHARRLVL